VHAILKDVDLSTPGQRWKRLEWLAGGNERWQPDEEQLLFLAGMNPAWHDCSLNRMLPGLLSPWQMGICQHQRPWLVCIHTHGGYLLKLDPLPRDGWETAATWRAMLQGVRSKLRQRPDPTFLVRGNALRQCIADMGLAFFFKPPSLGAASRESFGMLQLFEMLLPELMDGDAAPFMETWNRREIPAYPFHGSSPQKRMEAILQGKS